MSDKKNLPVPPQVEGDYYAPGYELDEYVKELTTRQKKLEVLELYKAGWSYKQISVRFKVKPHTVKRWISEELDYYRQRCRESTEELVQIMSMQFDEMIKSFWELAMKHKNFKAAEILIKVWERKAKLLGLDAPEKQVRVDLVSQNDMSEQELLEEAKRLGFPVGEMIQLAGSAVKVLPVEDPMIPPLPNIADKS